MKLSKLGKQPSQTFASVFLAFSLFGFLSPHHEIKTANVHHQVNMMQPSQAKQQDDWSHGWYKPPRSPGFDDLLRS
jgi:hypothetical protein